jgi:hypothetical protein
VPVLLDQARLAARLPPPGSTGCSYPRNSQTV